MKPVFRIFMLATALSSVAFVNAQKKSGNYHSSSIEVQSIIPTGEFGSKEPGGGYAKLGFGAGYTSRFHRTKENVGYFFDLRMNYQRNTIDINSTRAESFDEPFSVYASSASISQLNTTFGFGLQIPVKKNRLSVSTGFGLCGARIQIKDLYLDDPYGFLGNMGTIEVYLAGTTYYGLVEFGIPLKQNRSYLSFYSDLRIQNLRTMEMFGMIEPQMLTNTSLGLGMKFTYCFGQE